MRLTLVLSCLLLTCGGFAQRGGTATSRVQHDLGTIIQWQKNQIKVQKAIIHEKFIWRTLTKTSTYSTAVGIPVPRDQLQAHRIYLHKLLVRLAANVKEYKHQYSFNGSPRLSAWVCIHHYEGAWNANTGNGYYGGLQMDTGFQSTYGPELLHSKGTANNWTPKEQIMVADRAYESGRGFNPWPNTARACGLL